MHQKHQYRRSNRRAPPLGSVERVKVFPLPWGSRRPVWEDEVEDPAKGGSEGKFGFPLPLWERTKERANGFSSPLGERTQVRGFSATCPDDAPPACSGLPFLLCADTCPTDEL